jgi:hypothetical protein
MILGNEYLFKRLEINEYLFKRLAILGNEYLFKRLEINEYLFKRLAINEYMQRQQHHAITNHSLNQSVNTHIHS